MAYLGREWEKEQMTYLERKFVERFPDLYIDDPEDELNDIIEVLRCKAQEYFRELTE
jgi:hypothetical protein